MYLFFKQCSLFIVLPHVHIQLQTPPRDVHVKYQSIQWFPISIGNGLDHCTDLDLLKHYRKEFNFKPDYTKLPGEGRVTLYKLRCLLPSAKCCCEGG